jgi:3-dehydroquinate dehydratase-2
LNFIGIREPNIYGKETYSDLCNFLNECVKDKNVELEIKQSNHEGELVDFIQQAYYDKVDGIIINPGAYTHTSIALLDAVKSVNIKTIEVHLSDVTKREDFRQVSYLRSACVKSIMGKGFKCYIEAIDYFLNK